MLINYRVVFWTTIVGLILTSVASFIRYDAITQTIAHAEELADIGMFTSATIKLQQLKHLPENKKSLDAMKRIDSALTLVAEKKANFKNLSAALVAVEKYREQGYPEYGLQILKQVQEATMPLADTIKLAQAFQSFKLHEPVVYAIEQAKGLAKAGDVAGAIAVLEGVRETAHIKNKDKLDHALRNLQTKAKEPGPPSR